MAGILVPNTGTDGLVLINTTNFTSVSSFSLATDTFTSRFTNYKLVLNITSVSASTDLTVRMRAAGTDSSTSIYQQASRGLYVNNTAFDNAQSNASSWNLCALGTNYSHVINLEINNPKAETRTSINGYFALDNGTNWSGRSIHLQHNAATAYDSMTFFYGAQTFTGSYSIYGYNR